MQRALHGLDGLAARRADRAPRRRAARRHAGRRSRRGAGSTRAALVRVDSVRRPRRAAAGASWSSASGDVAGAPAPARGGRVGRAARVAARRSRASTCAGGGSTPSARCTPPSSLGVAPRPVAARPAGQRGSAALVLAGSDAPRSRSTARCSPASSSATPAACPQALTEQFRAAGLTHLIAVSGENVAFVLALFAPLLRRLGLRGRVVLAALAVLVCVRHDDPLGAVGAAGDRDGVVALLAGVPRPSDGGPARARAGRDRAAARRPVPAALGRVPAVVRREPRASRCWRARSPRGCAVRRGCARCSASPPPRRSAWRRC